MESQKNQHQSICSIILLPNNSVDIRFQGKKEMELSMLGALKLAEQYLQERLMGRAAKMEDESCKTENGIYNSKQERIVSKQEAIHHYLDVRKMIEERLTTIAQSDDKAQFHITEQETL